jgi:hypothetical protein
LTKTESKPVPKEQFKEEEEGVAEESTPWGKVLAEKMSGLKQRPRAPSEIVGKGCKYCTIDPRLSIVTCRCSPGGEGRTVAERGEGT